MKNKILSIALLSVMLLTLFVPLNAFASEPNNTVTIKAGTYDFNDEINEPDFTDAPIQITTNEQVIDWINGEYNYYIRFNTSMGEYYGFDLVYLKGYFEVEGEVLDCTEGLLMFGYLKRMDDGSYQTAFTNVTEHTILEDTEVDSVFADWYFRYTNYNEVNSGVGGSTPDMDTGTTQETATITKGNYTFKDDITFPNSTTSSDFVFYVTPIKLGSGLTKTYYDTMTFENNLLAYSNSSSSKVAFYGVPFTDYGWVNGYNLIHVDTDQTVSKEFYDIFMSNVNTYNDVIFKTYGKATLPDIDSVWTDKTTYPAMAIYYVKETGTYRLAIGNSYVKDYVHNDETFGQVYYRIGPNYIRYNLEGTEWVFYDEGDNSTVNLVGQAELVWTSHPIYTDETRSALFFHKASSLVNSLTVQSMTGVLTEILMILPIGMVCLISYMALRKGLKILVHLLQTA